MRGGGKVVAGAWQTPARLLRPGDLVRCRSWSGTCWHGGEPLEVVAVGPHATRKGWITVHLWYPLDVSGDDPFTLEARPVVPAPDRLEALVPPRRRGKEPKARKGEQLKLF